MKQVWLLLRAQAAEWKNRKKAFLLTGTVLIICMISTFSYVKNQESEENAAYEKMSLGVANEDESEYAKLLITYFTENETFSSYVNVIQENEDILRNRMEAGELDAYLVIPPMFAQSLMDIEHLPMKAVVSMKQPTKALIFRQVLEAYETYIKNVEINCTVLYDRMKAEGFDRTELTAANIEISMDLIFTALGKDDFFRVRTIEQEKQVALTDHYYLTALFFVGVFLLLPAGLRLMKLKQNGMVQRFKTMRIAMGKVVIATALPYVLAICCLVGALLCIKGQWDIQVFLCGAALLLALLAVVLFLGIVLKKKKDYLFAFSMLVMVTAVLGGSIVPKQYLPDTFVKVAGMLPNDRFVLLLTGNLTQVQGTLLAALVIILVFFICGTVYLNVRGEGCEDA